MKIYDRLQNAFPPHLVERLKSIALAITGAMGVFVGLTLLLSPSELITILNGLLVGALVSVGVAFTPLIWATIKGDDPYTRAEQMTLSFILKWIVIGLGVASSVYIRVVDLPTTALISVALARYLAIIAAILQVTAPDFGLGIMYGRDRKVIAIALTLGLLVALFTIYIQDRGVPFA